MESRILPTADQMVDTRYEAPCIEMVLCAEALEREIFYAGTLTVEDPWTNIPD